MRCVSPPDNVEYFLGKIYASQKANGAPDGRPGVHRVIVKGNPAVQLECFVHGEDGDHNTGGVQATAMRVLNAIPALCDHAPGLISTLDLPLTPSTHVRGA